MMSLSAFLLLQATAPAANASEPEEVTVIARRLEGVKSSVERDAQGKYHCALNKSTGLAALDAQLCKITTTCVRKGATDEAVILQCVEARKPALLAQVRKSLAAQRPAS